MGITARYASAKSDSKTDNNNHDDENPKKESLQDTVRRMQGGKDSGDSSSGIPVDTVLRKAADLWSNFSEEVGKAWNELLASGERKDINKKLMHPHDTAEGEAPYTGPVAIMVIDESEHLTAWERMQRRLTEAPIISGKRPRAHCIAIGLFCAKNSLIVILPMLCILL